MKLLGEWILLDIIQLSEHLCFCGWEPLFQDISEFIRITWRVCQAQAAQLHSPSFWFSGFGGSLRIYLPNKFPGTTDAVHQGSHFEKRCSSPRWCRVKNPPANAGDSREASSILGLERSLGEGNGKPIPVFLPGKFHGQRSLVGYCPWGHKSQTQCSTHTHIHVHSSPGVSMLGRFLPPREHLEDVWKHV